MSKPTPEERFWKYTRKTDTCWEWIGARTGAGYGVLGVNGRTVCAHRFAYELYVGPIPEGMQADHSCYNPSCVNPEHIRIVTPSHNGLRRRPSAHREAAGLPAGVHPNGKKWMARIGYRGKQIYLGTHPTIEAASAAVEAERLRLLALDGQ